MKKIIEMEKAEHSREEKEIAVLKARVQAERAAAEKESSRMMQLKAESLRLKSVVAKL